MKAILLAIVLAVQAPMGSMLSAPTAAAKTHVVVFDAAKMHVSSTVTGKCWTESIASPRADAYRCMAGNEIHDPCFKRDAKSVACPSGPAAGTLMRLTKPLQAASSRKDQSDAWLMQLAGGVRCNRGTGTVQPGYPFYCSGNIVCSEPSELNEKHAAFVHCGKPKDALHVAGIASYLVQTVYE